MKKPVKKAKRPNLNDRLNETNERLRQIESDIDKIQKYIGFLSTQFPVIQPIGGLQAQFEKARTT